MLPKVTALQYTVLHLLFAGRQSADELRKSLASMGICQSHATFHGLMMRLVAANYVDFEDTSRSRDNQTIHYLTYEVTDLGVLEWTAARKFYLNLAPPSADLVPTRTDEGRTAAYDSDTCRNMLERKVDKYVRGFAKAFLKKGSHRDR